MTRDAQRFGGAALALAALATLLVARAPVEFALASVFVLAGPHNWMEFRYAVARLPARLAPFRDYFVVAVGGVLLLTAGAMLVPGAARFGGSAQSLALWATLWNVALIAWIAALALLRSRQKPVRDWSWVVPVALGVAAVAWWRPSAWALALVYAHPIVSFVVLDRELRRRRREWRPAYHAALLVLPVLVALLCWSLRDAPPLAGEGSDALTMRLLRQAGGDSATWLSPRALVATLALLELLHYAVWIVALPVVTGQGVPWRRLHLPIAREHPARQRLVRLALGALAVAVVALWLAFTADYTRARDLYFTIAIVHVLAEVPVVLRLT
jgi:hypothetical protein